MKYHQISIGLFKAEDIDIIIKACKITNEEFEELFTKEIKAYLTSEERILKQKILLEEDLIKQGFSSKNINDYKKERDSVLKILTNFDNEIISDSLQKKVFNEFLFTSKMRIRSTI